MLSLGDVFVKIKGDRSGLDQTLGQAEQASRSFASNISGFLSNAVSFAVGGLIERAFNSILQAVDSLRQGMISGNAEFEKYQVQFKVLIGNAELAAQRMEELAQFGQETPFDLSQVVDADRILQAFGLHAADAAQRWGKSAEEIRKLAGDISAGTSASFQEIAQVLGRFAAGDTGDAIRRLQELGVVTKEELAAMGVEFDKAGSLVTPVDEALTAILQIAGERFGGMSEELAKTLSGMLSNLGDWWDGVQRILGEPIFDTFKAGLASFLEFVQPGSPVDTAVREFAETIRLVIGVLGDLARALVGDVGASINSFVERVGQALQQVNAFLRQLRDEIAGLSVGDILGELAPGLEEINNRLAASLETLRVKHERTLTTLENAITVAGDRMGQAMADIAEKYGPQIEKLARRIAETIADFNERAAEQAERFAKQRADVEERILKEQSRLEERLTELKKEHQRRRQALTKSLLLAESEEQYLAIQEQIRQEDERYADSVDKEKKQTKETVDELKKRQKEIDEEEQKANKKLEKQRQRTMRDLQEQMDELTAKRDEDTAKVQEEYDKQVELLKNKITAENSQYEEQQNTLRQMFADEAAELERTILARAEAIGTGMAASIGEGIREAIAWFNQLKATIKNFVTEHAEELKGALLAIGAVLLGAGIISGISALVGLIAGLISPVGLLIVAIGLLGAAWVGNWGDIQGKTQEVINWITTQFNAFVTWAGPLFEEFLTNLQQWWAENGDEIIATVTWLWDQLSNIYKTNVESLVLIFKTMWESFKVFLDQAQAWWQKHGDFVMTYAGLMWDNIKTVFTAAITIISAASQAFLALLHGDWEEFVKQLGIIVTTLWETIKTVFQNNIAALKAIVEEAIETIAGYFTDKDWFQIGWDVIGGLKDGILNAMGDLLETIEDASEDLLQSFKDIFGISSPSKRMADEVGKNIAYGLGQGIMSGMQQVQKQVDEMIKPVDPNKLAGLVAPQVKFDQTNYFPPAAPGMNQDTLIQQWLGASKQQTLDLLKQYAEG